MNHPASLPETYRIAAPFLPGVASGAVPFLLRQARKVGHVHVSEPVLLAPPAGVPIARAACSFRASVVFDADRLLRVIDPVFNGDGEPLHRLFQSAEQGQPQAAEHRQKLAALAGHDDWAAFAAWHAEHGLMANGHCWREVIGLAEVRPLEQAAA